MSASTAPTSAAAMSGADSVWAYLPAVSAEGARRVRRAARLDGAEQGHLPVRRDRSADGKAKGHMWMMEIRPAQGVFEVGWITYSPSLQRTRAATEAMYLIGDYGFGARLPALRMEVQQPQRAFEARGAALRLQVRGPVPPAHGGEGREPRHRLVLDHRLRVARAQSRVRALARAGEFRCAGPAEGEPLLAQRARDLAARDARTILPPSRRCSAPPMRRTARCSASSRCRCTADYAQVFCGRMRSISRSATAALGRRAHPRAARRTTS